MPEFEVSTTEEVRSFPTGRAIGQRETYRAYISQAKEQGAGKLTLAPEETVSKELLNIKNRLKSAAEAEGLGIVEFRRQDNVLGFILGPARSKQEKPEEEGEERSSKRKS